MEKKENENDISELSNKILKGMRIAELSESSWKKEQLPTGPLLSLKMGK